MQDSDVTADHITVNPKCWMFHKPDTIGIVAGIQRKCQLMFCVEVCFTQNKKKLKILNSFDFYKELLRGMLKATGLILSALHVSAPLYQYMSEI